MKVRLYKPHTHAGVHHVPGADGIEIDVNPHDALFLRQHGLLDAPSGAAPVRPARPPRKPAATPSVTPETDHGNGLADPPPADTTRT